VLDVIQDRLLVRPLITEEQTTAGGLILPNTNRTEGGRDTVRSTVVEVGPGTFSDKLRRRIEPDVKRGEIVYHGAFVGMLIRHEGEDLVVLTESEVLAVER